MSRPHPLFTKRAAGVLMHPTSLSKGHGIGDIGPGARHFMNWMSKAGLSLWQMLPIGPIGRGNSPYSGRSAFAGEPLLISLDDLAEDGLLTRRSIRCPDDLATGRTRYAAARRFKMARLKDAFDQFRRSNRARSRRYRDFVKANRYWLDDWCLFAGGDPDEQVFIQYVFDSQWKALRKHANDQGIRLVGDLPIFMDSDSADVTQHPELFALDRSGKPKWLTGVPPDSFSRNGQLWNHPQYRWPAHRDENWRWWTARFRQALDRFDALRLDHFIGFVRLWHVPASARTARHGTWRPTPGRDLLQTLRRRLGPLPIIAEDLGAKTPAVDRLRDDFGLPGMRILQWAFGSTENGDLPHNHPAQAVVYPGTHDNETASGWARQLDPASKRRFQAYAGEDQSPPEAMVRLAMTSPATWAICMTQDLLDLPPATRMNRPGVARGNWTWRLSEGTLSNLRARSIRRLVESSGRLSGANS